jgi:nucleotide-binding universal stress UspA family protein
MTNILIPTDFSENSWNATKYALSFFKNCKCTFYLLHVNKINGFSQNTISGIENESELKPDYKNKLNQLIQKIEDSNLKQNHIFFSLVTNGNIVDTIRNEVIEKHIDLIVMGTKGSSGFKKIAVGSNTTDVINKVKCTTLVIPENAVFTELENIALPTDYSIFFGSKILETISEVLNLFKSKLHIFHLVKTDEKIIGDQLQNKELLQDYFIDNKHTFHSITNKNLDIAIDECVKKHNIKLIAMVAKNIHFFQQLFYFSNTTTTSYQKEIPFLVLHE